MPTILIVCTANQCRSPVAAALLQKELQNGASTQAWQVESAGVWASPGKPAHQEMRRAALEVGLDLGAHRAHPIETLQPLTNFDLILTMEQSQKEAIQIEFPQVSKRVYLLSEMAGIAYDIADPIGGAPEDFRLTVREIARLVKFGLPRIRKLTEQVQTTPHARS